MSQAIVYQETKAFLKEFKEFKTIDAWRNQFENYTKEDGFPFPACFIRMEASNFQNIGGASGIQMYDLLVTLMIGVEVLKGTEYEKILELKQRVFSGYHRFEPVGTKYFGRFLRNGEEIQLEYDNILIMGQSYLCQNCTDVDAYKTGPQATIDVPLSRADITITNTIT